MPAKPELKRVSFFAAFMLVYMLSAGLMVEQWPKDALGNDMRRGLYVIQQIAVLAGFLIPTLSKGLCDRVADVRFRAALLLCYTLSITSVFFAGNIVLRSVFTVLCAVCVGGVGALVYALLAGETDFEIRRERVKTGRVIGFGGAAAVLLQWMLRSVLKMGYIAEVLLLAVLFFYLLLMLCPGTDPAVDPRSDMKPPHGAEASPDRASSGERTEGGSRGACLCAAICCILMLLAIYESHMNRVSFAGYFYGWTRLVTALGYLLIGELFGRAGRGLASLYMACIALVSVISIFLMLRKGEGWWLHLALFYLVLGSLVAYYNLMFMEYAGRTARPVMWASMGRMLDAGVTALFTVMGGLLPETDIFSLLFCILLLAGMIAAMALGGFLSFGESMSESQAAGLHRGAAEQKPAMSIEERAEAVARRYSLTPRETEVFRLLVTTEDKNQQIADKLYISRRQLQNHISSIYEKTGANTRAGLVLMTGTGRE